MKDCLVTRLKGVADNSNLPYFNSFKLDLTGETNAFTGQISCSADITIKDNEGGSITVTGNAGLQSFSLAAGKVYYIMNPSAIVFFVVPTSFTLMASAPDTDFSLFTNARILDMGGNIVGLPFENTGIETLKFNESNINFPKGVVFDWIESQGTMDDLKIQTKQQYYTMYDLAHVDVVRSITSGPTDGGEVVDYVAKKRGLGIETGGPITWEYITPGSTFNGVIIENRASNVLSWTADTITFGGTTISNSDSVPD